MLASILTHGVQNSSGDCVRVNEREREERAFQMSAETSVGPAFSQNALGQPTFLPSSYKYEWPSWYLAISHHLSLLPPTKQHTHTRYILSKAQCISSKSPTRTRPSLPRLRLPRPPVRLWTCPAPLFLQSSRSRSRFRMLNSSMA